MTPKIRLQGWDSTTTISGRSRMSPLCTSHANNEDMRKTRNKPIIHSVESSLEPHASSCKSSTSLKLFPSIKLSFRSTKWSSAAL